MPELGTGSGPESAGPGPDAVPPDTESSVATEPVRKHHKRAARMRAGALIGVLTALLGFAIVVQVHANSSVGGLSGLREDDLIGILDNQNSRADRLRLEISELQQSLRRLQDSGNTAKAAQEQAVIDETTLSILLGTIPATGPGVEVTIGDPRHVLAAEDVLDVVEELRGAGAEAISFGPVRVSTETAFTEIDNSIAVDSVVLQPPYRVTAIGDAKTMDTALNIPGGIAATIRANGGDLGVSELGTVTITVTRAPRTPVYAKSTDH